MKRINPLKALMLFLLCFSYTLVIQGQIGPGIPQSLGVGLTSSGVYKYIAVDSTGSLFAAGAGSGQGPGAGYIPSVLWTGLGPNGPVAVQVDVNGVVQTNGGGNAGASYKWMAAFNAFPYTFGGMQPDITETGIQINRSPSPTLTQQTRFEMRQFLSYEGIGVSPVVFYRMFDNSGQGFGWLASQGNPNPIYTSFLNYMIDLSTIAGSPVAPYPGCIMPRVSSYTGFYPLATTMFVGSRSGDKANSILFSMWQRTYSAGQWVSLASPTGVSASVVVPAGLTVSWVKDHVAGTTPSYTFSGGVLTVAAVADNPIDILLVPITPITVQSLVCT